MIDAHAHLDKYGDALPRALAQIQEHSIVTVGVSMDVESFERTRQISEEQPLILPSLGVHPWEAPRYVHRLPELRALAQDVRLIGEIGLDHFFIEDEHQYPAQAEVFDSFLDVAEAEGKVVNVHSKGAEPLVLEALQGRSIPGVIMHWYSGPLELIDEFLALGAYFTVGVEVLRSKHIQALAQRIPVARLLTETDNPGGWKWMHGELGFPELLIRVETALASLLGMGRRALSDSVRANMVSLLRKGGVALPDSGLSG